MYISYPLLSLFLACGEEETQKETFNNLPPFSPVIEIIPEKDGEEVNEADTTTDLRVKLYPESVLPEDPEGDAVSVRYVWLKEGNLSGVEGDFVTAADTVKGETWQVYAYANDGSLDSAPAIREITIQNARPTVVDVNATPANPITTDDLTVEVNSTADDDGDEVTVAYSWYKDGEAQNDYSENILPSSATAKGEQWLVQITPNDGSTSGNPWEELFTIANTLPVVNAVSLPENVTKETAILVSVSAEDIDDDDLEYVYSWYVNNNEIADAITETLDVTYFNKGDEVYVSIIANDGDGDSDPLVSDVRTVQNSLPVITSVSITDVATGNGDPITRDSTVSCLAETSDIDEIDTVTTSYVWSVDGISVGTTSELLVVDTSVEIDDVLVCTATANDGSDDGESMESSVTITNAALTLSEISLPTTAGYVETIQPSYTVGDADGDATITFTWYKGSDTSTGAVLPVTSESIDLSSLQNSGDISIGDTIFVVVTLTDEDSTLEQTSNTLEIQDIDLDEDGILSMADCNDDDVTLLAQAGDTDCDGIDNSIDYDDDGDGICDDDTQTPGNSITIDADCDAICDVDTLSADNSTTIDPECDGECAGDDDCDGEDNSTDTDDDGDGVCDDDTQFPGNEITIDPECDGGCGGDDDCDGIDNSIDYDDDGDGDCDDDTQTPGGTLIEDIDCDGILNGDDDDADGDSVVGFDDDSNQVDCDDMDPSLGDITNDGDCDSVLTADDSDDTDPNSDSDSDSQSDVNEFICGSDPLDDESLYSESDSDGNEISDCLE